ncbi:EcsC family protein [Paraconexibacter sp.]|uniref:EcsC family protein n=1 Tax=Paraconexibacter sp. TaxID=2949640 RepID=UPI0035688435
MSTSGQARDERGGWTPRLPEGVLDRLRADPVRAPEIIALAAADRHGPTAAAWLEEMRDRYRLGPHDLAQRTKRKHANLARLGGAATGVGGWVTVVPDLVALAWIQSRMVFHVAGSYGFDPLHPMRPAELLVLQELYDTPEEARAALDGIGTPMASAYVGSKLAGGRERALTTTLLRMVGKRVGGRVAGRLVPGVASVVNAVGNERETRALADRAITFYGG